MLLAGQSGLTKLSWLARISGESANFCLDVKRFQASFRRDVILWHLIADGLLEVENEGQLEVFLEAVLEVRGA